MIFINFSWLFLILQLLSLFFALFGCIFEEMSLFISGIVELVLMSFFQFGIIYLRRDLLIRFGAFCIVHNININDPADRDKAECFYMQNVNKKRYKCIKYKYKVAVRLCKRHPKIANKFIEEISNKVKELNDFPKKMFYSTCLDEKVVNLKSEYEIKKAILIANNQGLKGINETNIFTIMAEAREIYYESDRARAIDAERSYEIKECELSNILSLCEPYKKRFKFYYLKMEELASTSRGINKAAVAITNSAYKEKEIDWASLGGVASALGGAALGASVAFDAQLKNQDIRARNEENQHEANKQAINLYGIASDLGRKSEDYTEKASKALNALYELRDINDLFNNLEIKYQAEKTSTGAVRVKVDAKCKSQLYICGKKAVVDGFLVANIIANGKNVGIANLILPISGLNCSYSSFNGISLTNLKYNEEFSVIIEPGKLCVIEEE